MVDLVTLVWYDPIVLLDLMRNYTVEVLVLFMGKCGLYV